MKKEKEIKMRDSIKRLGYAIWALVAYDVFFTLIVLGVLKVNGII